MPRGRAEVDTASPRSARGEAALETQARFESFDCREASGAES
ncbi:hypothetical protein ACWD5V_42115 [Streptomyces sp. NPDC002523]